jgi:hypothetical protein
MTNTIKTTKQNVFIDIYVKAKAKVKQSRYTPWRRLGGEEV